MTVSFAQVASIYSSIDFTTFIPLLKENGSEVMFTAGDIIIPQSEQVMVVLDGKVVISDSQEAGLLLGKSFQFMPIGLIENHFPVSLYYIAALPVKVIIISKSDFNVILLKNKENLIFLLNIITYMMAMMISVYYERNTINGYDIIRDMIPRYLNKKQTATLQDVRCRGFYY